MNEKDLLEAIGEAKEEMLEKSEKKPGKASKLLRYLVAACLVFVVAGIGAVIGVFVTRDAPSPYPVFHRVSSVSLSNIPEEKQGGNQNGCMGTIDYEKYGVSFEAEVLRVFPDPYLAVSSVIYESGGRFYIAEVLVKDVIAGENIPQVAYITLPKNRIAEFFAGQIIVYSADQCGLEGGTFVNAKTGGMESFGIMFGGGFYSLSTFRDKNDPGIESAKQQIQKKVSDDPQYRGYRIVLSIASAKGELRQALMEIASPEIGQFSVEKSIGGEPKHAFICRRYIDGYMTDEVIAINIETGEVTYSDARYTAKDRETLPNLKKLMRKIDLKKLERPQLPENSTYRIKFYKFQGSYRKVNGEIYGLLGACWSCIDTDWKNGSGIENSPYPNVYKIYTPDGTFLDATEKELNSVLGIP